MIIKSKIQSITITGLLFVTSLDFMVKNQYYINFQGGLSNYHVS